VAPVIGGRTDGTTIPVSIVTETVGEEEVSYFVIPFAGKAGLTYTLKFSTSVLTALSAWDAVSGIDAITFTVDGEYKVPMTEAAVFYVISADY